MKLVLYNTYVCCQCDEFFGVFDTEVLAMKSILEYYKRQTLNSKFKHEYSLVQTPVCNHNEYAVQCITYYPNRVDTRLESAYYTIEDLEINEIYK